MLYVSVCVCASWKSATASHPNSAVYFFSISLLLLVFGVVCCSDELFTSCLRESVIRMVNMIFFSFFSKPIRKYVKQRLLWVIHSHFSIWWTFFGSVIQLSNTDKFELSAYVRCICVTVVHVSVKYRKHDMNIVNKGNFRYLSTTRTFGNDYYAIDGWWAFFSICLPLEHCKFAVILTRMRNCVHKSILPIWYLTSWNIVMLISNNSIGLAL